METATQCAYNITRNMLLSERVSCAGETPDQADLLALVMNGPGLDRHSGVWVGRVTGWIDLPRPITLDFVYLDERQTIVESGSVGLSAGFPPVGEGVTGALILANHRLTETGTVGGDQVKLCAQADLAALVKAASPSLVKSREDLSGSRPGEPVLELPTPYQVSRYSEFVFEPFAGSLVYMPHSEAPLPQSTEYFLPDKARPAVEAAEVVSPVETVGAEPLELPLNGAPVEDAKAQARRRKRARKKSIPPQEEPHFYTPKPIKFFDPVAGDKQESEATSETESIPERQSPQLSPELKAAILQIDEQLRIEKEELEKQKKTQPKEKKRKEGKAPAKVAEPKEIEAAHRAWEELAEPAVTIVPAEPEVFAEASEAVETPMEAAMELQPLPLAEAAEPQVESEPETAVEEPVAAFNLDEETVSPPELVWPAAEVPPLDEAASLGPLEPEDLAVASASPASEPRREFTIMETVAEAPQEIAEPAPVEKPPAKERVSLGVRLQRWIGGDGNRRKGDRRVSPGLVAFYWSGGAPRPHEIVNISKTGFYVRTKERWLPDTLVRMTLQRSPEDKGTGKESISVLARVVRIDEDGVGHEFVTTEALSHVRGRDVLPAQGTNRKELEKFLGLH